MGGGGHPPGNGPLFVRVAWGMGCLWQKGRTLGEGRWPGPPEEFTGLWAWAGEQLRPESPRPLVAWPHAPTPPDLASQEMREQGLGPPRRVVSGRSGAGGVVGCGPGAGRCCRLVRVAPLGEDMGVRRPLLPLLFRSLQQTLGPPRSPPLHWERVGRSPPPRRSCPGPL